MIVNNVSYIIIALNLTFFTAWTSKPRYNRYQQRIIGGQSAKRHQFPYVASICQKNKEVPHDLCMVKDCRHICGATIISSSWLISAAFCFTYFKNDLRIVAGILRPFENHSDVQIRKVSHYKLHPNYIYNESLLFENNIALIKCAEPFRFTEAVKSISLPNKNEYVYDVPNSVTPGWGIVEGNKMHVPPLRYLTAPIITLKACRNMIKNNIKIPITEILDEHICTLPKANNSACYGDAGGPLIVDKNVVGIISFTVVKCSDSQDQRYPNCYTRISSFLPFIYKNVKDIVQF